MRSATGHTPGATSRPALRRRGVSAISLGTGFVVHQRNLRLGRRGRVIIHPSPARRGSCPPTARRSAKRAGSGSTGSAPRAQRPSSSQRAWDSAIRVPRAQLHRAGVVASERALRRDRLWRADSSGSEGGDAQPGPKLAEESRRYDESRLGRKRDAHRNVLALLRAAGDAVLVRACWASGAAQCSVQEADEGGGYDVGVFRARRFSARNSIARSSSGVPDLQAAIGWRTRLAEDRDLTTDFEHSGSTGATRKRPFFALLFL